PAHLSSTSFPTRRSSDLVLKNNSFEFRCAFDDWVQLWRMTTACYPELHSHHGAVAHAAIQLRQTFVQMIRVEIHKSKRTMFPTLDRKSTRLNSSHQIISY